MASHRGGETAETALVRDPDRRTAIERRRQLVVDCLSERDRGVDVDSLVAAVASKLRSESPRLAEADRLRTDLHHVDLPLLDDLGIVAYDADERRAIIDPGARARRTGESLSAPETDDPER